MAIMSAGFRFAQLNSIAADWRKAFRRHDRAVCHGAEMQTSGQKFHALAVLDMVANSAQHKRVVNAGQIAALKQDEVSGLHSLKSKLFS
ncbi:MAG: hypothetical protein HHJ12_18080 [Glaciimonas sp.]|nr:hypothetical protein [Glaciimonas sp.]